MNRQGSRREPLRQIVVRSAPGDRLRGILTASGVRMRVALGRSGISGSKREGDGHTPRGTFRLVSVLHRSGMGRKPVTRLPLASFGPDFGWCDDPRDSNYNRPVRLPYAGRHEPFWRDDQLYDIVVVLDFNLARPRPGAGSAIFMHVAAPDLSPTDGCVSLLKQDLLRLLERVGPETTLTIV